FFWTSSTGSSSWAPAGEARATTAAVATPDPIRTRRRHDGAFEVVGGACIDGYLLVWRPGSEASARRRAAAPGSGGVPGRSVEGAVCGPARRAGVRPEDATAGAAQARNPVLGGQLRGGRTTASATAGTSARSVSISSPPRSPHRQETRGPECGPMGSDGTDQAFREDSPSVTSDERQPVATLYAV